MAEHTKGKWVVDEDNEYLVAIMVGDCFCYIADCDSTNYSGQFDKPASDEAYARRIVACVNKLAGWPISILEDETLGLKAVEFDDADLWD